MHHIWWECPKIRTFWIRCFWVLRKLMGLPIAQQPHLTLLNDLPPGWPRPMKHLVYFNLLASKITIAGAWKTPSVSFRQLKHKISWITIYEMVASIVNDWYSMFEWTWEPWATFVHTCSPIFNTRFHVVSWLLLYTLGLLPLSGYTFYIGLSSFFLLFPSIPLDLLSLFYDSHFTISNVDQVVNITNF